MTKYDDLVMRLANVRCEGIEEMCWEAADIHQALTTERDALAAEVERLRKALEPFADIADEVDDDEYGCVDDNTQAPVTVGQCRTARAALEKGAEG